MNESAAPESFTQLLVRWGQGDRAALNEMLPHVYDELRKLASYHLKRERKNHTLQATALVNEAYLRLINQREVDWKNRAQFLSIASESMRRILVDYARDRAAEKRGGDFQRISLSVANPSFKRKDLDMIELDDALKQLAERDARKSRVVELKFFGGLTTREIAEVLQISHATVEREWTLGRTLLYRALSGGHSSLP